MLFVSVMVTAFLSCSSPRQESVEIEFSDRAAAGQLQEANDSLPVLSVALAPVISPRESYMYYDELFDYLGEQLQMKVEYRQRLTYMDVNRLLERNQVDIAFICTGSYAAAPDRMDILVTPVMGGQLWYNAYVVTHVDSDIQRFEDLEERSFAFTDPLSLAGKIYPLQRVLEIGKDTSAFFGRTIYTAAHDVSLQMVARNLVEAASVSSLIYHYLEVTQPELLANLRIIDISEPYGIPPVVNALLMDQDLKKRLRSVFLNMHHDPQGREILDKLLINRFQVVGDTLYQSVIKTTQLLMP